jgi:hypothetical protein
MLHAKRSIRVVALAQEVENRAKLLAAGGGGAAALLGADDLTASCLEGRFLDFEILVGSADASGRSLACRAPDLGAHPDRNSAMNARTRHDFLITAIATAITLGVTRVIFESGW